MDFERKMQETYRKLKKKLDWFLEQENEQKHWLRKEKMRLGFDFLYAKNQGLLNHKKFSSLYDALNVSPVESKYIKQCTSNIKTPNENLPSTTKDGEQFDQTIASNNEGTNNSNSEMVTNIIRENDGEKENVESRGSSCQNQNQKVHCHCEHSSKGQYSEHKNYVRLVGNCQNFHDRRTIYSML
ncbi:uncharacterized protein [Prorops nasuta]|uniref:uncharacterized protein isoform X2 n=1 Tax=Prorops nasuta TaxID=863751 RepID=UPI0034CE72A1